MNYRLADRGQIVEMMDESDIFIPGVAWRKVGEGKFAPDSRTDDTPFVLSFNGDGDYRRAWFRAGRDLY